MIATHHEAAGAGAGSSNATARGAADWLSLAAAPTFAIIALLTGGGRLEREDLAIGDERRMTPDEGSEEQ